MNLGPTINTAFDEDAPFIHPNGKTLYYSSKGLKTMGGYDIFKSSIGDEYWSTPQNIGYPVNTVGNDIFFVLASDGKRGYYSSHREGGHGGQDIYAVSFENSLESLRIVKGNTSNATGEPLASQITLLDEDGNTVGLYSANSLNGNYIIILPPDQDFQMLIEVDGYKPIEEDLSYQGGTITKERIQNYTLQELIDQ